MTARQRLSPPTYTAAELARLAHEPVYDALRLELDEGKLIAMSPASFKHGVLASRFDRVIGNFVDEHDLGVVTAAETGFILRKAAKAGEKDTVRAPDVGLIVKARLPAGGLPETGFFPGAPDLAVEIVSPNDDMDDLARKIAQYLAAGTRMVIAAFPESKTLRIHTPAGVRTLGEADTLDGGDLLPGFSAAVAALFRL